MCERGGVGVRLHDPPPDEAARPCLRTFHTVSEGEFSEVPRCPDYMRRGFLCRAAGRYAARVQKTMRVGPGGPLGFLGRRAADRAPNVVQCALRGCFTDDLVAVRYVM